MTPDERRWVNSTIESADAHRPANGTVSEHLFDTLSKSYDRLNAECAELHRDNKRLEEQATYAYVLRMQRELKRARRFVWALAVVCFVLSLAVWAFVIWR